MNMNYHLRDGYGQGDGPVTNVRCPTCKKHGVFSPINGIHDVRFTAGKDTTHIGFRVCPDAKCKTLILTVIQNEKVLATTPPELIEFDTSDIPPKVVAALTEALVCHAHQCYIASAMLLRKTLELLCDAQGATGANLKERVIDLSTKIVAPKALVEAIDNLRLLGNDAAHVQSKDFDSIGKEEIEVSVEFTKEVLKAVYQLKGLVAKLVALKKPST